MNPNETMLNLVLKCMRIAKILVTVSALFLSHYSMSQWSISFGISNKIQTDKYSEPPYYYSGKYTSQVKEENAIDGLSIGVEYKRNNFILVSDVVMDFHMLKVNTFISHNAYQQASTSSTQNFYNYNVNYGLLGLRISPQFFVVNNKIFGLTMGPSILIQHRLYENEFNHYDSTYYKYSYYNQWTNESFYFPSSSASDTEYDGITISSTTGRFGLLVTPRIELNDLSILINISAGIGSTVRSNNQKIWGLENHKVYLFCQYGLKFVYPL